MSALEALDRFVRGLTGEGKAELDALLHEELLKPWLPSPKNTPQLEAYLSPADLLLYGGAAGGGKTDLLCGYALCDAKRSVIFRRQSTDLRGFWDRLTQLCTDPAERNSVEKRLITQDGRLIECGHLEAPNSEKSWQGRPHDFIGFDEGAQLTAHKVNFVLGWLRSAVPEDGSPPQRCRAIIASNPPIQGEGEWLIEWFAPWLDPMHPQYPVKTGELRWAITVGDENTIKSIWVAGPGRFTVDGGPWSSEADGEPYDALSRTYIPSRLEDNPYLANTGYRARVNAMPEPIRSQLLYGNFLAGRRDAKQQVIPSDWVRLANQRWEDNKDKPRKPMTSMGVDVAQGGLDKTVVARLREIRFEPNISQPGRETPDPVPVVQLILGLRRDEAGIAVDHGGGYGGGVSSHLQTHNAITTSKFVPSATNGERTRDSSMGFINRRAEMWWRFREALDPMNPDAELIELPSDPVLTAQLTAPHWKLRGNNIQVESKDDIRVRLGSSTDEADAVLMAWLFRLVGVMRKVENRTEMRQSAPLRDPLEGW